MTEHRKHLFGQPSEARSAPGELTVIGVLTHAHGIKGEISLNYYAESPEWLDGEIWLRAGDDGTPRPAKVAARRMHNGQLLVRFEGVNDRTEAERLRGLTVLIPEELLPESDEDTLYLHDLLGLDVLLHESGAKIGVLAHVDFIGGQELWSIEAPDGKEILFPAVPEFVNAVDLEQQVVRISPPPGLLELYTADSAR